SLQVQISKFPHFSFLFLSNSNFKFPLFSLKFHEQRRKFVFIMSGNNTSHMDLSMKTSGGVAYKPHTMDDWVTLLSAMLRRGALDEHKRLEAYLMQPPPDTLSEGPPMVVWSLTKTAVFTVKSLNLQLRSVKFPSFDDFPASTIWNKVVLVKIQGFTWLVFHGRILTLDVLQAKGLHLPNRCAPCCI
ncbi:hypothetical protein LINPERHAP2_LOCUS12632, partial [Linum perenne]